MIAIQHATNLQALSDPRSVAASYAGWEFIACCIDERGFCVTIERGRFQYSLRGRIGEEWLAQNLTDEQIAELL